jgi:hypothetical protein
MLVTTLSSRDGDDVAELVLAIARQGTTANRQGAVVDRQGAAIDCQHTDVDRQGATIEYQGAAANCQGAVASRQGVVVNRQGVFADCQDVVVSRQDAANLAASRPKKALATRCVDGGGYQSRCMDLHAGPMVGVNSRCL